MTTCFNPLQRRKMFFQRGFGFTILFRNSESNRSFYRSTQLEVSFVCIMLDAFDYLKKLKWSEK